jgi:hypothetical protein
MALTEDQETSLSEVLDMAQDSEQLLSDWERTFIADFREKYEKYGATVFVSAKQWGILDRIRGKLA